MENFVQRYLCDLDLMNMSLTSRKNMDEKVSKFLSLKAVGERGKKLTLLKFNSSKFSNNAVYLRYTFE